MSSQGPFGGTIFSSDSTVGVVAWNNPSNASASDGSFATSVLLISQLSNYLKATGFGFFVPLDAIINGILVEIQQQSTVSTGTTDNSVKIVKGGIISGNEKATGVSWPTSEAYQSYGGSSDLWGLTWTPSDINSSNFGVACSADAVLASTAEIDYIRITVYWTGSNRPNSLSKQLGVGNGQSRSDSRSLRPRMFGPGLAR